MLHPCLILLQVILCCGLVLAKNPTNIIMILADDLGFGDTDVFPFVGNGVKTPHLREMAARGAVLSNFYTAATVCTPTRASVLTGMYPWRMGIRSVFEYGIKDKSDRDNYLAHVPTAAMIFKEAGYFTGHSGKWHLGGMRQDDYDMRQLGKPASQKARNQAPVGNNNTTSKYNVGSKCPHPGPNQQGFTEYVSVLDGPSAPRQNKLQQSSVLYSQGCNHLIRNDVHIGRSLLSENDNDSSLFQKKGKGEGRKLFNTRPPSRRMGRNTGGYSGISVSGTVTDTMNSKAGLASETLSECEARHAIRMMKSSVAKGQPFYLHLWFHAPHGPWQYLNTDENRRQYPLPNLDAMDKSTLASCTANQVDRFCVKRDSERGQGPIMDRLDTKMKAYMSMVTNMDKAIGDLLKALKDLGIEKDTMVVFTSDNGPENDAGAVSLSKLAKNPWPQWNNWNSLSTTVGMRGNKRFVYEGGIKVPAIVQWVGTIPNGRNTTSVMSTVDLLPTFMEAAGIPTPPHVRLDGMSVLSELVGPTRLADLEEKSSRGDGSSNSQMIAAAEARKLRHKKNRKALHDRVLLWHNDYEGPRATAARYRDFKLILDGKERPFEMFDLRKDPLEVHNLLGNDITNDVATVNEIISGTSMTPLRYKSKPRDSKEQYAPESLPTRMRGRSDFHKLIFKKLYRAMLDFALHGNACHAEWVRDNPGRQYDATAESDNYFGRGNPYKKISRAQSAVNRERMLTTTCASPCSCDVPVASQVQWPWNRVNETLMYMMPGNPQGFLNGSELLLGRIQ